MRPILLTTILAAMTGCAAKATSARSDQGGNEGETSKKYSLNFTNRNHLSTTSDQAGLWQLHYAEMTVCISVSEDAKVCPFPEEVDIRRADAENIYYDSYGPCDVDVEKKNRDPWGGVEWGGVEPSIFAPSKWIWASVIGEGEICIDPNDETPSDDPGQLCCYPTSIVSSTTHFYEEMTVCIHVSEDEQVCPPPEEVDKENVHSPYICDPIAVKEITGEGGISNFGSWLHPNQKCCYPAEVARVPWRGFRCAVGRPYTENKTPLVANIRIGSAWIGEAPSDQGPIDARLSQAWLAIAQMEHASVAAFAKLTLDLLALGRPMICLRKFKRPRPMRLNMPSCVFNWPLVLEEKPSKQRPWNSPPPFDPAPTLLRWPSRPFEKDAWVKPSAHGWSAIPQKRQWTHRSRRPLHALPRMKLNMPACPGNWSNG